MHEIEAAMTPRQRVRAALGHKKPDRVPFSWGFGPTPEMEAILARELARQGISWRRLRALTEDIVTVSPAYIGPALHPHTDIWGIVRRPMAYEGGSYDEFAHHPLAGLETAEEIDAYAWPDPSAYADEALGEQIRAADPEGLYARKLAIDVCGNPFEIYCWMTGLEQALMNLILRPDLVRAAMDRITGFFEARLRRALGSCGGEFDLLFMADDLGGQAGPLMSAQAYREIIQPYHRRQISLAKEMAPQAAVLFHSDGSVRDLLPDLAAAGVDALEAVQTDARGMQPEELKGLFGDRLCFHGGISVQALLPRESEAAVESECRRLVRVFGRSGGYVAAPSHAIQVGTPPGNVLAMLRGVLEGRYEETLFKARLL